MKAYLRWFRAGFVSSRSGRPEGAHVRPNAGRCPFGATATRGYAVFKPLLCAATLLALSASLFGQADSSASAGKVLVLLPALINADAQHQWIAGAIQQSLTTDLTRHLPQSIESGDRPARSINDALDQARGVDATQVVTGAVQFNGDQLRFTGQIVDVKTAKPIAAIIVTGQTRDLFVLEDSITEQATKALLPRKTNPTTAPAAITPSGPLRIDYAAAAPPAGMEYALPYQDDRFAAERDRHFLGTPSYYYGGWGWGWGYAPFGWWYSPYPTASPGWAW